MAWQKGESGNPGGRPKKQYSLTEKLREIGEEPSSDGVGTKYEHVCRLAWADAEAGDASARREIVDRLEGKPKERIEQEGETVVKIVFDNDKVDPPTGAGEVLEQPGEV